MPYHEWGDEDFDWDSLDKACRFFQKNLQRWARLCCYTKEKYGTMRLEAFGYNHGLYGLIFPGHIYTRYPGPTIIMHRGSIYSPDGYTVPMLRLIDEKITTTARFLGLSRLLWSYQRIVFNALTIIAIKKWPHIKKEITAESEFQDLLYKNVKKYIGYKDQWISYTSEEVT